MDGGDEMIHGLSEEEKFKVIRPMLGEHMLGDYGMPIIHKTDEEMLDMLKEEKRSLKDKLEKVYEFMKQFVIGGMNLLEKFLEWIGEKVKDVGRGR